jgi:hypothetical protein
VSAQLYNDVESDEKDWVLVQAATTSDINGEYALFLSPGTYNIVAFAEGYNPGCIGVEALRDTVQTQPFVLIPATETGTIGGNVTISDGSTTQHVTISFRQVVTCNGGTTTIEVTMRNIANGGNYSVNLPAGTIALSLRLLGKPPRRAMSCCSMAM